MLLTAFMPGHSLFMQSLSDGVSAYTLSISSALLLSLPSSSSSPLRTAASIGFDNSVSAGSLPVRIDWESDLKLACMIVKRSAPIFAKE